MVWIKPNGNSLLEVFIDRGKSLLAKHILQRVPCQEAALTRRTSWRCSGEGVGLGLSGKQLHPATPELTAWRERPADSSQ